MTKEIQMDKYRIKPEESAQEIHFAVYEGEEYLFRLVPSFLGFELSQLEKGLHQEVDQALVDQISSWIE